LACRSVNPGPSTPIHRLSATVAAAHLAARPGASIPAHAFDMKPKGLARAMASAGRAPVTQPALASERAHFAVRGPTTALCPVAARGRNRGAHAGRLCNLTWPASRASHRVLRAQARAPRWARQAPQGRAPGHDAHRHPQLPLFCAGTCLSSRAGAGVPLFPPSTYPCHSAANRRLGGSRHGHSHHAAHLVLRTALAEGNLSHC